MKAPQALETLRCVPCVAGVLCVTQSTRLGAGAAEGEGRGRLEKGRPAPPDPHRGSGLRVSPDAETGVRSAWDWECARAPHADAHARVQLHGRPAVCTRHLQVIYILYDPKIKRDTHMYM